MSKRSKVAPARQLAWRWRRSIARDAEPLWTERLGFAGELNWMIVERPQRVRLGVEAYFSARGPGLALRKKWGGSVERFVPAPPKPAPPVRVNDSLEIAHDEDAVRSAGGLIIPYGIAFGSGEHHTTLMLLRALASHPDLAHAKLLDLGTGSGVLALAARRLGARHITATDFDPDAIRTARQNEALNFPRGLVKWQVGDVKRLRGAQAWSLVLANLFSGILVEAAPRIARALVRGGELWLSGVLRDQQDEVAAAFRAAGLRHVRTTTRGKWVMQRWARAAAKTTSGSAD
jgi:ribosomal protein L11 methyltransferase